MEITKTNLQKIIEEEIFELLLMEAKIKVSYEDIEAVKTLHPNEQDEKALEDLWKKHEKVKEDQKARAKTKALIYWLKTNYISKKRTDHPPHEALPVVEEFVARLNSIKQKYKDDGEFKEKVNKLTKGKPPQINLFSAIDMEKIFDAFEKKAGDIEGSKEKAQKDKIGETQNWEIFMPTRIESSCEIGKGTTWCTARTRGDNLFYNYILESIVLFHVIKKNAGSPEEHPDDYLNLGYREDGSKIEIYEGGYVNINSDNEGIDPQEFEAIVGAEESQEIYYIIKKRFQDFKEHPAKELLRKAGQDLEVFNSMFTKGQSPEVVLNIIKGINKLAKENKGASPEVSRAATDKVVKMLKNNKIKEKLKKQSIPIENIDFQGVDFSGVDFKGLQFFQCDFRGVDFKEANLQSVHSEKCSFSGCSFQNATLMLASLNESDLRSADFSGADLRSSSFQESRLGQANFLDADLQFANLIASDLREAIFLRVDLTGADLTDSDFELADFREADLDGANLRGAELRGAIFNKARLEGESVMEADFREADLRGAILSTINGFALLGDNLEGVDFREADLEDGLFDGYKLNKANFHGANLQRPNFEDVVARGANFQETNLKWAKFSGADLGGALFASSKIENPEFISTNLQGADFRKSKIKNANFAAANLDGASFERAELDSPNFEAVKFDEINFNGASIRGAYGVEKNEIKKIISSDVVFYDMDFGGMELKGIDFNGRFFRGCYLGNSDLQGANLEFAHFEYSNFEEANLQGANLEMCELENANLGGVNLQGANLEDANLIGAGFGGANLKGANLKGAIIEGTNFYMIEYDSNTIFPEGFDPEKASASPRFPKFPGEPNSEKKELKSEMKFNKSKLFKMIKEEILLELLLMEAKLKVSLDDLELAEKRYPEDEALAKLRKDHEDKTDRAKTKKMIFWVKTAYAGDKPQEVHPPREALPQLENFLDNLKRIKNKYKGSQPFKEKIDQITDGGKIGGDALHPNLFNSDNFIGIMRALEGRAGEVEKDDVQAEKDKIGETENWNVYMPTTMGSSCELGKGTTWCTARTEGNNLFYNYVARKQNTVLFYAIHKEAGSPKEDPEDYLSLGYFEDGRRVEEYGYGGANIDADNTGIDPKEFELIVGKTEAEEIYSIIEKKFETMKEHPAKEMVKKAAKDLKTYNSAFPKGMGGDEALDLIRIIDEYGPLPKEIEKSRHQKLAAAVRKGAKLKSITLRDMDLSNLKRGKIKGPEFVNFNNVNLEKTDLREFTSAACEFTDVNLKEADMTLANIDETLFKRVDMQKANLRSVAFFNQCELLSVDMSDANLRDAKFYPQNNLYKVNFTRADLQLSLFEEQTIESSSFEGADLDGVVFKFCRVTETNFNKAKFKRAELKGGRFSKSTFREAIVENSEFTNSKMTESDFSGSKLGSIFNKVNLQGANFSGADLTFSRFYNCNLEGANFSGAILSSEDSHVEFENCNLEGSTYNSETVYDDMMVDPEKEGMTMA